MENSELLIKDLKEKLADVQTKIAIHEAAKTQKHDQDRTSGSEPLYIRLLKTDEFEAFYDLFFWGLEDQPSLMSTHSVIFEDAWVEHCRGLEADTTEPLAGTLSEPFFDRKLDRVIVRKIAESSGRHVAAKMTAGRWDADKKDWKT